jgi:hypothetical protein
MTAKRLQSGCVRSLTVAEWASERSRDSEYTWSGAQFKISCRVASAIVMFRTEGSVSVSGGTRLYQNFLVNLEKVERLVLVRSRKNDKARNCDDCV